MGCGQPDCVADYRKRTLSAIKDGETYPIYCDPDRKLYEKLGMAYNLKRGPEKPEYITISLTNAVLSSMKNVVTSGAKGFKGGECGSRMWPRTWTAYATSPSRNCPTAVC